MEEIFFVKSVGALVETDSKKEPGTKFYTRTIVLAKYGVRNSDNGSYLTEHDFVVDLWGQQAQGFQAQPGNLLAACLSFTYREYQDRLYQTIRLDRYAPITIQS